jgi:ribose 5-phosphate isomerase B
MAANKSHGVRCALCWSEQTAKWAREHNDANMLSIGERTIDENMAITIVRTWLETPFEGGRHIARVAKIEKF